MLKPRLLLLLLFFGQLSLAQNRKLDSLDNLLKQASADTNKVKLYYKRGASTVYQDPMVAVDFFKKGLALATQLKYLPGMELCNTGTCFAFVLNGKYDSALAYINISIPLAIKMGDPVRLSLVYLNRGDLHTQLQNYPPALKDCDTSIYYAEKITDYVYSQNAQGRINGIIAGIYTDQAKYREAELYVDRSLGFFERAKNRRMIAMMISDKAGLYNKTGQQAQAVPLFKDAIRIGDSINDQENLSSYYMGLSESYHKLKRYAEAKQAGRECIRICEQTGNDIQKAAGYMGMAEIAKEEKDAAGSIDWYLKSYEILLEAQDTMRMQLAAEGLSEVYLAVNDPANAFKFLKISSAFKDSLMRKTFDRETAKLQTTFSVKEKDKEILLLSKEKELQNQRLQKQFLLMLGAAAIALLAIAGIWLLMNRNKLRQRMKELELRNRIAADLHDEVGSSLSSIHMLSQMASQKTSETGHQDILSRMSANAKETMDKMGDIVWMIKPGETEAGSLKQRMERFAYEVGASKNMEVMVELEELEKVKLSMEQRKNIYLIFKEAVNNAAKYSGTRKIAIGSSLNNKELRMFIKDEGNGFDHQKIKKGNGLGNMMNRAAELGGRLDIGSAPEAGTVITLTMPV